MNILENITSAIDKAVVSQADEFFVVDYSEGDYDGQQNGILAIFERLDEANEFFDRLIAGYGFPPVNEIETDRDGCLSTSYSSYGRKNCPGNQIRSCRLYVSKLSAKELSESISQEYIGNVGYWRYLTKQTP